MNLDSMQSFSRYICSSADVCCMLPGLGTEAGGLPEGRAKSLSGKNSPHLNFEGEGGGGGEKEMEGEERERERQTDRQTERLRD